MKKLLSYLLLSLVVVVLLLMVVSAGAQTTTRIKLTQIEKSNTVNGTKANQVPVSNGVGDLRYSQYTEINPVSIGYTPALTGNPVANYAQFVKPANGDVWYIDNEGRGIRLYVAASAGDYDWLEIANNQIPNAITDSIYKYKYASIGGRLVWPTAEMLVIDSVAQGMFIVAGDRKAKVALYDTNNQTWCTLEQGGGTTALIMQDQGTFSIQTAGSGTPQAPGTPIVEHFNVLGDSSIQFPQYPSARTDAGTPTKLWGPDATGRMKNYAVSALPVTLPANVAYLDSVNTFTRNQINSYTSTSATPAERFSGTWFTGGGNTNTKPHVLIEPAGATSNTWSASGTGLGINAASGFGGSLIHAQVNGADAFRVFSNGSTVSAGSVTCAGGVFAFNFSSSSRITSFADNTITLLNSASNNFERQQFGGTTSAFPALQTASKTTGTCTFTAATAAIAVTTMSLVLRAGDIVTFTTTGALPAELNVGQNYYVVGTPTATSFQVASTFGGTAIVMSGAGSPTTTVTRSPGVYVRNAANTATATLMSGNINVEDIRTTGKLFAVGNKPTVNYISASGTSGTATVDYGSDAAFHVTFTAGSVPGFADYLLVTLSSPFAATMKPIVACTAANTVASNYTYYVDSSTKTNSSFQIYTAGGTTTSAKEIDVIVVGGR